MLKCRWEGRDYSYCGAGHSRGSPEGIVNDGGFASMGDESRRDVRFSQERRVEKKREGALTIAGGDGSMLQEEKRLGWKGSAAPAVRPPFSDSATRKHTPFYQRRQLQSWEQPPEIPSLAPALEIPSSHIIQTPDFQEYLIHKQP